MAFFNFLYLLIIKPLELVFEVIYVIANRIIGNPGMSIIALSLAMNFLVLPLYRRADELQAAQQEKEKQLAPGIAHLKKTFKGDERFMMLQEYYRQNDYKPSHALRGSLSLLLEIPFFIAAFRFLSELSLIKGISFGPISDLGKPDELIHIGSHCINLLPILMTLINIISGAIYTKGMPLKSKIQLNLMALIFLVFLYKSPSGLVFYWTLNNIFSLIKNIFYKLKNPAFVLKCLAAVCGVFFTVYFGAFYDRALKKRIFFFILCGIIMMVPLVLELLRKKGIVNAKKQGLIKLQYNKNVGTGIFFLSAVSIAVMTGLLIPSSILKASPAEFLDVVTFKNPAGYLKDCAPTAFGIFVVWFAFFYGLMSKKGRNMFAYLCGTAIFAFLVDYMVFGKAKSDISSYLQYNTDPVFPLWMQLLNIALILLVAVLFYLLSKKSEKIALYACMVTCLTLMVMSISNIRKINYEYHNLGYIKEQSEAIRQTDDAGIISLSKEGKNVVVIMMDRAIGAYIPYIMEEKPELKEKFDGFTYYHNTISYGRTTNFGAPALYGGYEYTPSEMNERSGEYLKDKHDEAIRVMPVLFLENDYEVTVTEPPLAGYKWIPDLSVYEDYPEIRTFLTNKRLNVFSSEGTSDDAEHMRHRNFFCLSIVKSAPLFMQSTLYSGGTYNEAEDHSGSVIAPMQVRNGRFVSSGIDYEFYNSWLVLNNLGSLTRVEEGTKNTFNMYCNEMTHQAVYLQLPDYEPKQQVDNSAYASLYDSYEVDGMKMKMDDQYMISHYQSNMSAMMLLGQYFDYLRAEGVYDNTRIIVVSDHGRDLSQFDELMLKDGADALQFSALLMVKDFNCTGFTQSEDFMTNADVPTIATGGLIQNPVNPFTGNAINTAEKTAHDQLVLLSRAYNINSNNGKKYKSGKWYSVHENMYDKNNWTYEGKHQ